MRLEQRAEGTAIFAILLSLVLGACFALFLFIWSGREGANPESELPSIQSKIEEAVTLPEMTLGEQRRAWLEAIEGLIQESNKVADASNAGHKFDVCFITDEGCELKATASRDEFKKTTFYFPEKRFIDSESYLGFYLSMKDEDVPHLLMRFVYVGSNDWLSIDKASILVNGELIWDEYFSKSTMERGTSDWNLRYEVANYVATDQLDLIEKIANAEVLAIRIEGSSGYVDLSKDMLNIIQVQAAEVLFMHQLIMQAIEKKSALGSSSEM